MRLLFPALLLPLCLPAQIPLRVDATDAPRRVVHVRMTLPAKPGPMTLLYPKWIPGEHEPSGPIVNLVGLKITAAGQAIPWRRDTVNMFSFHVDVPPGVSNLDVAFDFLPGGESSGAFSGGASTTTELAVLNWNQYLLYPEGSDLDHLQYQATLKVPAGWRYGTALPIARESGDEIQFKPVAASTLIDSPVSAGRHYRTIELGTDLGAPHYMHLAADSDRALEASADTIQHWKNAVAETGALFGSRHYGSYHFLFTLSDHVARYGLEHHESSDDRDYERTLIEPALAKVDATLLPHEVTHSWNGKFRRPEGLVTGGYDAPMKGDLLWVYEGLTNYLGEVIAARSGLWTQEDYREHLAMTAANLDSSFGRRWRPLEDTAIAAQILYEAPEDFSEYRRSTDFYPEGSLLWLEADVLIRQMSKGSKSLNDFCRAFHGGPGGKPDLKPYKFEDVVAALNAVQPYDWAGFLDQRVRKVQPRAPLGGITNGGWKLVYSATRSEMYKAQEEYDKNTNLTFSIGLKVKEDATITDLAFDGPAAKAGIAPGTKLIAVNGRQFNPNVIREAIEQTSKTSEPLELLVKAGEFYKTYKLDYHGGERYPKLERDGTKPDLVSAISAALVKR